MLLYKKTFLPLQNSNHQTIMQTNPTQKNTTAENAKPAKKQWQKPDFQLLDSDGVNTGPLVDPVERRAVNTNGGGGRTTTKSYQS